MKWWDPRTWWDALGRWYAGYLSGDRDTVESDGSVSEDTR